MYWRTMATRQFKRNAPGSLLYFNAQMEDLLMRFLLARSPIHQTADKLRVKRKSDELPNKDGSVSKLSKLVQISLCCCQKDTANGLCVAYCCCCCFQCNALIACELWFCMPAKWSAIPEWQRDYILIIHQSSGGKWNVVIFVQNRCATWKDIIIWTLS